jgi:hypothetical protein
MKLKWRICWNMNLNDLPTIIPLFYLHVIKAVLTCQCECIYAPSMRMCVCVRMSRGNHHVWAIWWQATKWQSSWSLMPCFSIVLFPSPNTKYRTLRKHNPEYRVDGAKVLIGRRIIGSALHAPHSTACANGTAAVGSRYPLVTSRQWLTFWCVYTYIPVHMLDVRKSADKVCLDTSV